MSEVLLKFAVVALAAVLTAWFAIRLDNWNDKLTAKVMARRRKGGRT